MEMSVNFTLAPNARVMGSSRPTCDMIYRYYVEFVAKYKLYINRVPTFPVHICSSFSIGALFEHALRPHKQQHLETQQLHEILV